MNTVIRVRDLAKTFVSQTRGRKLVRALQGVGLDVREGEILGILGPNGAGKTTFLNILSTLLLPDAGTVDILDIPSSPKNFHAIRRMINMSSGYPNFPWSMTVEENLRFYGRLYGLSGKTLTEKTRKLIEMFELTEYGRVRFDELSSGNKQKLSLAKSMLNDPRIIFLDEPTTGLDPEVAVKTRQIILDVFKKAGLTVLLTTHNMQEAELMCERIAFIQSGQIVKLASPAELKSEQGKRDLEEVFIELVRKRQVVPVEERTVRTGPLKPKMRPERPPAALPAVPFWKGISLWLNSCTAFFYRNFLFATRNFFVLMELLFWPMVSLISIGLLGDFVRLEEQAVAFVLTGAVTAGVLQVTQLDVAYGLLYEVWSKSLKQTSLTPVGVSESMLGSWLMGILRGSAIFFILGIAAGGMFGFTFPPLEVILVFLLGIFGSAFLLGLLVNFLLLIFGQKAEITAWMFAYVFMLVSGIYYPVETMPPFFYHLGQWIPITYFLEYFRAYLGFEQTLSYGLWKGFGLLAVYAGLGLLAMRLAFFQARRKGTIVRLSE